MRQSASIERIADVDEKTAFTLLGEANMRQGGPLLGGQPFTSGISAAVEGASSAILMLLVCLTLAGCAPQEAALSSTPKAAAVQPQQLHVGGPGTAGTAVTTAQSPVASTSDYRVLRDDVLQITVFQVQDFNRDAQVDAAGNIVLPLIGLVPVAGKTVREVESDIAGRLKAKYLQNPQVIVTVKDAVGLRVAVQGAVKSPGLQQIRGDTTLGTVIAQAQGFSDTADKSSVLIIRNTDEGRTAAKVDAGAILDGAAPDPRVYGGDTVVVNDSFIRVAGKDALTILTGAAAARMLFP